MTRKKLYFKTFISLSLQTVVGIYSFPRLSGFICAVDIGTWNMPWQQQNVSLEAFRSLWAHKKKIIEGVFTLGSLIQ